MSPYVGSSAQREERRVTNSLTHSLMRSGANNNDNNTYPTVTGTGGHVKLQESENAVT